MRKRTSIAIWAGISLIAVALGIAAERTPPSALTMSLVTIFQFALGIWLFIWFMDWPRQPTLWELQKKRRQKLLELRGYGPEDSVVKPPERPLDPPLNSG